MGKIAESWGDTNNQEVMKRVGMQLTASISLAQEYEDIFADGYTLKNYLSMANFPLADEWEQLMAYRWHRYTALVELTNEEGIDAAKPLWKRLKRLDLMMGRIMLGYYPLEYKLQEKRGATSEEALRKALTEWTLPENFDPKNPFPDTPYPKGALD